jgi:Protein of unknown function (DUF3311)
LGVLARSIDLTGLPNPKGDAMDNTEKKRGGWSWWYLLFVVQFAVALWPPLYNKAEPALLGLPFFYWFQLFWVLVSAVFTAIVYYATKD